MRNQKYRVRIKPKVKLQIAVLLGVFFSGVAISLWFFINSNFYKSKDNFEFKSAVAIEPLTIRKAGKYPYYDLAKFKLPSGAIKELQVNTDMAVDSKYCFSHVYKNGKFIKYQLVAFENCI